MARATGDFITFVDSDDWVHPQMFEVLRNAMDYDVIMAVCANKQVRHQEPMELLSAIPPVRKYPSLRDAYHKDGSTILCVWAHLYRTAIVIGRHFDEGFSLSEDTRFNLMLEEESGKCAVVEKILYFYFQRDTSAIHTASLEKYFDTAQQMMQLVKKENSICQGVIYEYAIKKAFAYRYDIMFTREHNQAAKATRTWIREAVNEMRRKRLIPNKKIVAYTIMNDFPILYRIYRIAHDPTLLEWEKEQKRVRKRTD